MLDLLRRIKTIWNWDKFISVLAPMLDDQEGATLYFIANLWAFELWYHYYFKINDMLDEACAWGEEPVPDMIKDEVIDYVQRLTDMFIETKKRGMDLYVIQSENTESFMDGDHSETEHDKHGAF